MTVEEFFAEYANLPLEKRFVALDQILHPGLTFNSIWQSLHELEDKIRPVRMEQGELLKVAISGLNNIKENQ